MAWPCGGNKNYRVMDSSSRPRLRPGRMAGGASAAGCWGRTTGGVSLVRRGNQDDERHMVVTVLRWSFWRVLWLALALLASHGPAAALESAPVTSARDTVTLI